MNRIKIERQSQFTTHHFFSPLDPSVSHRYSGIGGSVSMNENIKWHAINGKQVQFIMLFLSSGLSSCMFKPEWDRAPSIK